MSEIRIDNEFEKELVQMWQENTCPLRGDSGELARQLAGWVDTFDRQIFWRNLSEYAAGAVVILGLAGYAIFSDRLIAPLTGIGATLFVLTYLWWKHRGTEPLDPSADASAYRAALLRRYDRQIQMLRSARYWYVLPFWIFFLTVLGGGTMEVIQDAPGRFSIGLALAALGGIFLFLVVFSVAVVRRNERYGVRTLKDARKQAEKIITESLD